MITLTREEAQQVLDVLNYISPQHGRPDDVEEAIETLRTRLAQPEPTADPHSWYSAEHDEWMTDKMRKEHKHLNSYTHRVGGFDLPLYTSPPQRESEPVACPYPCGWDNLFSIIIKKGAYLATSTLDDEKPLSDHQRQEMMMMIDYAKTLASWGKNITPQPQQEKQEPVGYVYGNSYWGATNPRITDEVKQHGKPLYTTPQPQREWVGLTDAEIEEFDYYARDLVMDIEKALRQKNT